MILLFSSVIPLRHSPNKNMGGVRDCIVSRPLMMSLVARLQNCRGERVCVFVSECMRVCVCVGVCVCVCEQTACDALLERCVC